MRNHNNLFWKPRNALSVTGVLLFSLFFLILFPVVTHAQIASDGAVTPNGFFDDGSAICPVGAQQDTLGTGCVATTAGASNSGPISCSGANFFFNPFTCIYRVAVIGIASALIYASGWLLGAAGVLFNAVLELTVGSQAGRGFDYEIYPLVRTGIESAWTAFRDIANIIIIGMFTFIALTMILGIESFNARKMVARVLLIAILINFSLLFTRIIISSSNFVAGQFYKAAKFDPSGGGSTAIGSGSNISTQYAAGISGRFAQIMGVGTIFETKDALWKVAESSDSGNTAFVQGLFTAAIFLATSLVFLYATFLLIARAILFILLLITSSLAFASYLIPGGNVGGYGWSQWWNSLLKNAVFGPILLIMLWATIQVGEGIKNINGTKASLGGLLADPAAGGSINALFSYLIILGMLYASIKIATSFAGKVGGFGVAKMIAASPLALGARFAGFAGRNIVGRGYALRSEGLGKDVSKLNTMIARAGDKPAYAGRKKIWEGQLKDVTQKKEFADKIAGSKFSLADTKTGAKLLKDAGVPAAVMGGGKGVVSYGESQKKIVEDAAKRAADATKLSSDGEKTIRDGATVVLQKQKEVLEQNIQVGKTNMKAEEASRKVEIDKHENDMRTAQANHDTWQKTMPTGTGRDAALNSEKVKIEKAKGQIDELRKQFRKNAGLDTLEKQLAELYENINAKGNLAVAEGKKALNVSGENLAATIAHKRNTNILPWATGENPENDQTTRKARSAFRKKVKEADEDRLIDALRRKITPAAPPTPGTP